MAKLLGKKGEGNEESARAWEEQLDAYIALRPLQGSIDKLEMELPALQEDVASREKEAESTTVAAEEVRQHEFGSRILKSDGPFIV